jgi:hypothetical protein
MTIAQERAWDYLLTRDPDELVDILGITSEELLDKFDDKVDKYVEENG